MLFNSIEYLFFLPITVLVYYLLPFIYRKFLLLAASYYFYMQWNAPYILLIIFSTIVDYIICLQLGKDSVNRKLLLGLSLTINMGLLILFKYYDFFIGEVNIYFQTNTPLLKLILPMGISFYTFQTMSYTIDVYNKKIKPEKDFFTFSLYVSFFPQLVAGPIERAGHLLNELKKKVQLHYINISWGAKQIIWGLFKKIVIADNLSLYVEQIFSNYESYNEGEIFLGIAFFAIQIYCDFSGYSDIAIGSARLLGIKLNLNFNFPYFSSSITEFWKRWHISLSSWFRDYLYIPLGGNRVIFGKVVMNLMIVFLVSGLWHGANWTFIIWGGIHGVIASIELIRKKLNLKLNSTNPILNKMNKIGGWLSTLIIVLLAWVFFRAENITEAFGLLNHLINQVNLGSLKNFLDALISTDTIMVNSIMVGILILTEFLMFTQRIHIKLNNMHFTIRWTSYSVLLILIILFGAFDRSEFIYFQF